LGGLNERLSGWETFTLLRALFSSARAGEFVVLSARGFVASLLTRSHGGLVFSEGKLGGWETFTLLRALFSSARAGEFEVLSARGFVASLLTRSHDFFFSSEGKLGGLIEWLGGWETFTLLRALFSPARAGEFVVLNARGFVAGATHPLAR
jgi:hypothetical protein